MNQFDKITQAIFQAIDEINDQLPDGRTLEKSLDTVLYDRSGRLDSLRLVNLIVATEQAVEKAFGRVLVLADDKAVAQERSPFRTVRSFAEFISDRLRE